MNRVANVGDDVERNESIKINFIQDRAKNKIPKKFVK